MPDDLKELIGRYATGSLSAEEKKRLFDAALDDQDLFDQLAQEQQVKQLLAGPGARDRLIHALEPPRRKAGWIFGVAATAALTVVLAVFLLRPAPPTQQEVAVAKNPPPAAETAPPKTVPADAPITASTQPTQPPVGAAKPTGIPEPVKQKVDAVSEPSKNARAAGEVSLAREVNKDIRRDAAGPVDKSAVDSEKKAENRLADRKELDQVAVSPPPAPVTGGRQSPATQLKAQQSGIAPQNAPGGPSQNAQQNSQQNTQANSGAFYRAQALAKTESLTFGFHYSVETKGHLILIAAADGFLSVKANNGAVLFAPKQVAAGILIDIVLPDAASSASVTFSTDSSPVRFTPTLRTDPEGTVQGPNAVSVEIKINK